jgi:hypothetical protein
VLWIVIILSIVMRRLLLERRRPAKDPQIGKWTCPTESLNSSVAETDGEWKQCLVLYAFSLNYSQQS